ncbi:MAG: glycosyltransferase [Myxococcales bacterium]
MLSLTTVLLTAAAFSFGFYLVMVGATWLHTLRRRQTRSIAEFPAVSLLKPVKGLEENLEACLRSFFEQEYPGQLEIVFASATREDPAMQVARRLAREYPGVSVRFVLSDENWGLNPKVSNLQGALRAARHDLVLQSDANVWAPRDYLRSIVSELVSEEASLLSSVVSGIGERSFGSAIENLQLSAYVAPACCVALKLGGVTCVIGKSMLFRSSELKSLGGLERVKDSLAEDFLLGRHYGDSGKKVLLSATPIRNVNVDMALDRSLTRHARWLKMRAVIHPVSFITDIFTNPSALMLLAWLSSGCETSFGYALLGMVALKTAIDGQLVKLVRGAPMKLQHLVLGPVKDAIMFGVWVYASFSRSVEWRGIRLRLGADSQLLPDEGALPVRVLRRLLSA